MLDRLDADRELARTRSYSNKRGKVVTTPDHVGMARIDELALEVLGVYASPPSARGGVDLSVFNGGKAAAKKAG